MALMAKLADLKAALDIASDDSGQDAKLTTCLEWAASLIEEHLGRDLFYAAAADAVAEVFDGDTWQLKLRRFPVTELTSVKLAYDHDFEAATALVENEDFTLDARRGLIRKLLVGTRWPDLPRCLEVLVGGGYLDPLAEPILGVAAFPPKFQAAAVLQAVELYKRGDEPGTKVDFNAGITGVGAGTAPPIDVLPIVRSLLASEKR